MPISPRIVTPMTKWNTYRLLPRYVLALTVRPLRLLVLEGVDEAGVFGVFGWWWGMERLAAVAALVLGLVHMPVLGLGLGLVGNTGAGILAVDRMGVACLVGP